MYKFIVVYREFDNDITLIYDNQSAMMRKVKELKNNKFFIVSYGVTKG